MSKIPTYVFIVTCMHPKKDRDLSEILTEYLASLPHIKYEGHGSYSGKTCYMIQITPNSRDILNKMKQIIDIRSVLSYDVYKHTLCNSNTVYFKHCWVDSFNSMNMPYRIGVHSEDISKLISITQD